MKHKRVLTFILALAILLGCTGFTPAYTTQSEIMVSQTPEQETQSTLEKKPPAADPDVPLREQHVERLHKEEQLNTHVFRNKDGTKTMYIYDHPVKYIDERGQAQDISLDIADTGNGSHPFRTKANSAVTEFPAALPDGVTLRGNGVSIRMTGRGHSGRRMDTQTIAYTYDEKTTIEYSLTYTGFKEDIVVSEYTGQTEYPFTLYTNGLDVTNLDDSYYLTDDDGNIQAAIGEVIVFTADERNNTLGTLRVTEVEPGQQYELTIVLDADYLADPNTVYPIRIDPTVELVYTDENPNAIEEKTLQSNNTTSGSNTATVIGKNSKGISRTIMKFPGINFSALNGVTVISAVVTLRDLMCESEEMTITCYPFTGGAWTEDNTQWAGLTQSWGAALDSNVVSYSNGVQQATAHRYSFDITDLAQKWVNGTADENLGIIFKSDSSVENGTDYFYKTFATSERANYKPTFKIIYQDEFSIDVEYIEVNQGNSIRLTAESVLGTAGNINWETSNSTVASVDIDGNVTARKAGKVTITASCVDEDGNEMTASCTVFVKVPDGTYYIANASSGLCMANYDSTVNSNSVYITNKNTSTVTQPTQFWEITYAGNEWYVIRPVDRPLAVLTANNSKAAIVQDFVPNATIQIKDRWKISWDGSGYIFKHKGINALTAPSPNSQGSNPQTATQTTSTNCRWTLSDAVGIVLRDSATGRSVESARVNSLELGKSYSLADLGISCEYCGGLVSEKSWHSDHEGISIVNSTGTIKAVSYGQTVITTSAVIGDYSASATVLIFVNPFPNGTYRMQNRTTGMFVDIENQAMNADRTIHQWENHSGYSQAWAITHLGDGIYSIHSRNAETNYYLGVKDDSSSVDQPIVLRTGSLTNGMKWKIASTENGAYKLIPLSGESSGCVLATSTSSATSGAILIQGKYISNTSYRDEWYLHNAKYAYSIGGQFNNGQDAINAAENWSYCGYISGYNINPTTSILSYNRLNSEIVYFSTHGNQHMLSLLNNIFLTDGLTSTSSNTVEISDYCLPDARLYIYDACLTASNTDGTGRNLCTETIAAGAETVIGWTESIGINDATLWQTRFQSLLAGGATVIDAANFANTFIYESNITIKSWRIYGNENLNVCQNPNADTYTSPDNDTLKYTNIDYPTHDETNLKLILAGEFPSFSNEEAFIAITYTNGQQTNYVIDYVYYYNGYVTNSGYSIIVQNGIITHMRDNTNTNAVILQNASATVGSVVPQVTEAVIQSAFAQATAEVMAIDADYSITEQRMDKYYDIDTGKYYYRIISVYVTPDDTYGAICTKYELQNQEGAVL